ncbi:MAG TPA: FHA domain-containing protein [Candidatus Anoxymicrobiaceae bacterium]|jgi:pSer/pThr/pTyr-binding forkhead associated (FHA) protein
MFCPACGKNNPEESAYCCQCGSYLAVTPQGDTTITLTPVEADVENEEEIAVPEEELTAGAAMLVVKRGPNAGTRFVLTKPVTTVGRHPESDMFLDDITVSRRHAEISNEDGSFRIVDMGSLNGTYVNKLRVEEADLSSGDEIQIGKFRLIFFCK